MKVKFRKNRHFFGCVRPKQTERSKSTQQKKQNKTIYDQKNCIMFDEMFPKTYQKTYLTKKVIKVPTGKSEAKPTTEESDEKH